MSFEAVLSLLRRDPASSRPFVATSFLGDGAPACGFAAAAELAFEDFSPETGTESAKPQPSDDVDSIAIELALSGVSDSARLQSARRRFMWANHPDRRPDLPRDLANRRVAIANMLIDRALKLTRPDS